MTQIYWNILLDELSLKVFFGEIKGWLKSGFYYAVMIPPPKKNCIKPVFYMFKPFPKFLNKTVKPGLSGLNPFFGGFIWFVKSDPKFYKAVMIQTRPK